MNIDYHLLKDFADLTAPEEKSGKERILYGTYRTNGSTASVQIDGSTVNTPVQTTTELKNGDRVTVIIKDHTAIVTGNLSDPAVAKTTVDELARDLDLGLGKTDKYLDALASSSQEVTWHYTDENGQLQTITGKRGGLAAQLSGLEGNLNEAKKVATNFCKFEPPYGLIIGDLTKGNFLGCNALIDSTSLMIRYNSEVLARYSANQIDLGLISNTSRVTFCNDGADINVDDDEHGGGKRTSLRSKNILRMCNGYEYNSPQNSIELYFMEGTGNWNSGISIRAEKNININAGRGVYLGSENNVWIRDSMTSGTSVRLFTYTRSRIMEYLNSELPSDAVTVRSIKPNYDGQNACGLASNRWSNIYSTNATINTSDRNQKRDIAGISDAHIKVFDELRPVEFYRINGDRKHLGLIAQEVEEVMANNGLGPEDFAALCIDRLTVGDESEKKVIYGLRYEEFIPLLIEKVHRLESRIKELEGDL